VSGASQNGYLQLAPADLAAIVASISASPDSAPATLVVRRPSGARYTFVAASCHVSHGLVTATGHWKRRTRVETYTWPADVLLEVRWHGEAAVA
jgi:hypothetical protein